MRPKPDVVDRSDPASLRRRALDLLARREHSARELRAKLEARGFEAADVAVLIRTLRAENLLSDARYAQSLARVRVASGKGPFRIKADLCAAGVSDGEIEAALASLDVDWVASAREARARRFGATLPATAPDRARQMRFLQQRGFEHAHIRAALAD